MKCDVCPTRLGTNTMHWGKSENKNQRTERTVNIMKKQFLFFSLLGILFSTPSFGQQLKMALFKINEMPDVEVKMTVNGWAPICDKYGRTLYKKSPVITYGQMKSVINSEDSDLEFEKDSTPPYKTAKITGKRYSCEIVFVSDDFDGKNNDSKLMATVCDTVDKKNSERHVEHEKKRGFFGTVIDHLEMLFSHP